LSGLEFAETDKPITEEDRDGLAQFTHFLAYMALNANSSKWADSIVARDTLAYRALECHFGHLAGWEEIARNQRGLHYRQLAHFLMRHYPAHPPDAGQTKSDAQRPHADNVLCEFSLDIAGLGFILYSPPAVAHIPEKSNYLKEHFWVGDDVARHVMDCQITAFCTGTPGSFWLRFLGGPLDETAVQPADFKIRLGLQVRSGMICVRDLYDLKCWSVECPIQQQVPIVDGWYRLTVFSSRPSSGVLGDNQIIDIHLEPMTTKPPLRWDGVPQLC
jgi:hypothetical protein